MKEKAKFNLFNSYWIGSLITLVKYLEDISQKFSSYGLRIWRIIFYSLSNTLEFVLDSLYPTLSNKTNLPSFYLPTTHTHTQIKMENKDQDTHKISRFRLCKIFLFKCRFLEKYPRKFTPITQIGGTWRIFSQFLCETCIMFWFENSGELRNALFSSYLGLRFTAASVTLSIIAMSCMSA